MKTSLELALEKADKIAAEECIPDTPACSPTTPMEDARPPRPPSEDESTIEYEGHKMFAVARRLKAEPAEGEEGEILEAKERIPLDIKHWQRARVRAYLTQVARRLKKDLDEQQGVTVRPVHQRMSPKNVPGRELEDKVLRRNHAIMMLSASHSFSREDPKVTQVLNSRIAEIQELVYQTEKPDYYEQSPEHFGRANALREALGLMIGKEITPLRLPEKWRSAEAELAPVIPLEQPTPPPEDDAA